MKTWLCLTGLVLFLGCQTETLDIRANYRIKLNAASPGATLKLHQPYALSLELSTDSYYQKYGYQLQFYQQSGLGKLERTNDKEKTSVLQKVAVSLPLGLSAWQYTPKAIGSSQVVLVAQQERGYTQPDTVRLLFQVMP
ncbi:DUF3872 domain-containing protein [Spirosoma sp. BT702]|uniref:DUF3872 domain-containing protein n=1 Tax=Spirosoma profusum TaxID=2771354 RepID=A0A926XYN5_9BACT|nr:TraQ conjugal transfer family protein [Spirosoma profusum]MBD2703384.1 DUF3872 domain-containing protein [Spirosoma profusum]